LLHDKSRRDATASKLAVHNTDVRIYEGLHRVPPITCTRALCLSMAEVAVACAAEAPAVVAVPQVLTGRDAVALWSVARKLPGTLKGKLESFRLAVQNKHPSSTVPPLKLHHLRTVSTPSKPSPNPRLSSSLTPLFTFAARDAVEPEKSPRRPGASRQEHLLSSAMATGAAQPPVAQGQPRSWSNTSDAI